MKKRKRLNIGHSDFKNIIQSNSYFIDKSLFIKEIIDTEKNVLLFPRPRRFGKTLNLSMVKCFFDQRENENLFKNLEIWKSSSDIKNHYGKYPVLILK